MAEVLAWESRIITVTYSIEGLGLEVGVEPVPG
jgi:hypothetical protein